nr:RNA polymerase sporulation sigma factor SigK [uncultured Flavonifractor sp.]
MIPAWILLLFNQFFFTLRLSGGGNGSFPRPLKAEEERNYLELAAQGDLEARNKLIEHNLRLVAHIVKKYYTPNGDQDDLISIGTIGLIKGISTFKPDKKVRLATYASRCIENEILMHFRSQRKSQGEVSLSDAIDGEGEGNALSLMDTIRVDDNMLEDLDTKDACLRVRQYVRQCLEPREAAVIALRYGLNERTPLTQREVAAQCGISRSYVSRIEKKALKKLEEAMNRGG